LQRYVEVGNDIGMTNNSNMYMRRFSAADTRIGRQRDNATALDFDDS
jgi:hypothetical protein